MPREKRVSAGSRTVSLRANLRVRSRRTFTFHQLRAQPPHMYEGVRIVQSDDGCRATDSARCKETSSQSPPPSDGSYHSRSTLSRSRPLSPSSSLEARSIKLAPFRNVTIARLARRCCSQARRRSSSIERASKDYGESEGVTGEGERGY